MASRKRSEAQRAADLVQMERLHLKGKTEHEITDILNAERPYELTRNQIHYDLASLAAEWRAEAKSDKADAIAREFAHIKVLQGTYWSAWERSLEEKTKTRTEKTTGTGAGKASVEKESLFGNPSYLAGVMSCIERRCKLLGLDAPLKNEHTGKGGAAIEQTVTHAIDPATASTIFDFLAAAGAIQAVADATAADGVHPA